MFPYFVCAPTLVLMLVVDFYPILFMLYLSVFQVKLLQPDYKPFVGFDNYLAGFRDPVFWESTGNSFIWAFSIVLLSLVIGLVQATLLNQDFKGRGFFRALFFFPYILPSVVTAMMWKLIFEQNPLGLANHILISLNLVDQPVLWLNAKWVALFVLVGAGVWKGTGFFAVMLLAGLQAIPTEFYDAGRIDGCSSIQLFFNITIPSIKNIILITSTVYWIWMFNWLDLIWILTKGGPGTSTHILTSYAYAKAFKSWDFGYAGMLSVVMIIIMISIVTIMLRRASEAVESL